MRIGLSMAKKQGNSRKSGKSANPRSPAGRKETAGVRNPSPSNNFLIVGVGASAGGLEAFTELLHSLPDKPGMALVFIQHLDPKHVSMLAQILGRESKMPVLEARDKMPVEPDHVYVIPRNTSMTLKNRTLRLGPRNLAGGPLTSVDTFFQTLADDQGARSIGVLLSGNASDGTLGLLAIKAAGGIALVQDPQSAKHDGMPRSAIAAGCVDFIQEPSEIAKQLVRLAQHPFIDQADRTPQEPFPGSAAAVNSILAAVRSATGVNFAHYKPNTVRRRILRRMVLRHTETADTYLQILRHDLAEVHALYNDILINVTESFATPTFLRRLQPMSSLALLPKANERLVEPVFGYPVAPPVKRYIRSRFRWSNIWATEPSRPKSRSSAPTSATGRLRRLAAESTPPVSPRPFPPSACGASLQKPTQVIKLIKKFVTYAFSPVII